MFIKIVGVSLIFNFMFLSKSYALTKPEVFDLVAEESKQYEQTAGKSFGTSQQSAQGEEGKKGYLAQHASEKGESGHHDKERHQNKYAEEGGNKQAHHHDDGYYLKDHKGSHGKKGYHYVDKGSYAKGHDTKGHHNIRKLDEFQKKKEFFDEDHDEGHKERHGSFGVGKAFKKGEFKEGGHADKAFFQGRHGAAGKFEKGGFNKEEGGHKKSAGRDRHFKTAEEEAKKGGSKLFKEFGYSQKTL